MPVCILLLWKPSRCSTSRHLISYLVARVFSGKGNNADRPYNDRGEGIMSTQKVGNFSKKKFGLNMSRGVLSSQHKHKYLHVPVLFVSHRYLQKCVLFLCWELRTSKNSEMFPTKCRRYSPFVCRRTASRRYSPLRFFLPSNQIFLENIQNIMLFIIYLCTTY